jgi:hypothetical protein
MSKKPRVSRGRDPSTGGHHNNQGPISLHPLNLEDALRAALNTPPPPEKAANRKKTAAKKAPRKKK